jgi:hypothetical protein
MKPTIGEDPLLEALDLQPARAASRAVGRLEQLTHDALEAHGARLLEDERRRDLKVLR